MEILSFFLILSGVDLTFRKCRGNIFSVKFNCGESCYGDCGTVCCTAVSVHSAASDSQGCVTMSPSSRYMCNFISFHSSSGDTDLSFVLCLWMLVWIKKKKRRERVGFLKDQGFLIVVSNQAPEYTQFTTSEEWLKIYFAFITFLLNVFGYLRRAKLFV